MKESKNIDRLFQEKFKDFEASPSDLLPPETRKIAKSYLCGYGD